MIYRHEGYLTPYCEELEPQASVVGPQEVCPDRKDFQQLQCVQEVHGEQVEHRDSVKHVSSVDAHLELEEIGVSERAALWATGSVTH